MDKISKFLETTFVNNLISDPDITDISYNGKDIYYEHNIKGRCKSDICITNEEAYSFLRQIANLADSQFSVTSPILDVTVDNLRINAIHNSICRKNSDKCFTFSIRIISKELKFNKYFQENIMLKNIINLFIDSKLSIVISGLTGVGKTEVQKSIIYNAKENIKFMIIDNINELDNKNINDKFDISLWKCSFEGDKFNNLLRAALRNNPDYLVIAESRGKEMSNIFESISSGIPTITTIHSPSANKTYKRITKMIKSMDSKIDENLIFDEIKDYFKLVVHVEKTSDENGENYERFIDTLLTNIDGKLVPIFTKKEGFINLNKEMLIKIGIKENIANRYFKEIIYA